MVEIKRSDEAAKLSVLVAFFFFFCCFVLASRSTDALELSSRLAMDPSNSAMSSTVRECSDASRRISFDGFDDLGDLLDIFSFSTLLDFTFFLAVGFRADVYWILVRR